MEEKYPILRWWPVILAVIAAIAAFVKLQSDVSSLKERVSKLEDRVDPLRQLRVGKGDLCLKLIEQYGSVKDGGRQAELLRQWDRTGCEGLSAAAMNMTNAVEEVPPPPKPQPEQ